jgi:hypothetical protein
MEFCPIESMMSKAKENKAFAHGFRDWITVIQQSHATVEHMLHENMASADRQEHPDGGHLFGPKLRAASGGFGA